MAFDKDGKPIFWHSPEHQERIADFKNQDLQALTSDPQLPRDVTEPEQMLKLAAKTAAKMMRAAHRGQQALNAASLFPCDGQAPQPIMASDGASIQILKRLAMQVEKLERLPLEEDETELERHTKIAHILSLMTRQQAVMEAQIAKAVGLSYKAQQESARLMHDIQKHKDKMALAKDKLTAADIEAIADE